MMKEEMKRKEKDFERERVKEAIAECFIKGYTKARTAERVQRLTGEKMYPRKLNRLLAEILATWGKKGIRDKVLMREVELKKIDAREAELWQAWEDSKATDEAADARYLAELRRCSEQRSRLLGLAAAASRSKKETPQGTAPALVWKESRHYGTDDQAD